MANEDFLELSDLQDFIRYKIGNVDVRVRVELDSHSVSGGHHYFGFIEKAPDGRELAKARGIVWRSNAGIIDEFERKTGISFVGGISIVARVTVEYNPRFGMSLIILEIDPEYSIGLREMEKRKTLKRLADDGDLERQSALPLPFLPGRVAVISSETAAGYGDFTKHLNGNSFGFKFDCNLYPSLMQGENAAESIVSGIRTIIGEKDADIIIILRGGGAESDLFCFDDYALAKAIASCPIPVLTAIGHERDCHIADMVANRHFKTPTAAADFLVEWVCSVEEEATELRESIFSALNARITLIEQEIGRYLSNIGFAIHSRIDSMDHATEMLYTSIKASDPRNILKQGYVLAADGNGRILRSAHKVCKGDDISVCFSDGTLDCTVNGIKKGK